MKIRVFAAAAAATAVMLFASAPAAAQSLTDVIAAAEAQLGGEAYDAGRVGRLAEVELLSNGTLVEGVLNYDTGALVDSESYGAGRRAAQVRTALNRAVLTLPEAIDAALAAVGPGEALEAQLRVSGPQSGRQFIVDVRTATGLFDVIVDAASGRIIRVIRD